jgi:hypothetical protein
VLHLGLCTACMYAYIQNRREYIIIFLSNNNVDENTFILLRENYLEMCRIFAKTNTRHA